MYRYISRESCSQFDSLPLTSLTPSLAYPQQQSQHQHLVHIRERQHQRMLQEHSASLRASQQRQFASQYAAAQQQFEMLKRSGREPSAPLPPAQRCASAPPVSSHTDATVPPDQDSGAPQSMQVEKARKRQRLDDASVFCFERSGPSIST